jgi:hypothetical protein
MTRLIGAVMAVALLVSVAPVMAGDSFHALSRLPAGLSPLDDAQLATIEGGQNEVDVCVVCLNIAVIVPIQVSVQTAVVTFSEDVDLGQLGFANIGVDVSQETN